MSAEWGPPATPPQSGKQHGLHHIEDKGEPGRSEQERGDQRQRQGVDQEPARAPFESGSAAHTRPRAVGEQASFRR
jgi:hypothetical protein